MPPSGRASRPWGNANTRTIRRGCWRSRVFFVGYAEHDGQHGLPELRGNEEAGTARRTEGATPAQQFEGAGRPADVPGIRGRGSGGEDISHTLRDGCSDGTNEEHTAEGLRAAQIKPPGGSKAIHNSVRGGQRGQHGQHGREQSQEFAHGCQWASEPDVGRVAHGIPNRVDRLKCLGNAVVPQQAYPIFRALAEELKRKEGQGNEFI